MSLEKNIERIADALEAIARMKGTGMPQGKEGAAAPQAGQQVSGQPPVQQGAWQGGAQPQQMQQPMQQGGWQGQPSQGGQVPVSQPAGLGTQWPGAGSGPAQTGSLPLQQSGMPVQQAGGSGTVPTTAAPQQYTFDQLAVATANLVSSGKDVFTILGRFGVSMLMDLPPERYGEYAAALREAGGVI